MYLLYSVNAYIFNVVIEIKFYSILFYSILRKHVILEKFRQSASIKLCTVIFVGISYLPNLRN